MNKPKVNAENAAGATPLMRLEASLQELSAAQKVQVRTLAQVQDQLMDLLELIAMYPKTRGK